MRKILFLLFLLLLPMVSANLFTSINNYYTFDNTNVTGITIIDLLEQTNWSNIGGNLGQSGKIDEAIYLSGTNSFVLGYIPIEVLATNFSFSFWFYPNNTASERFLVDNIGLDGEHTNDNRFFLSLQTNGTLRLFTRDTASYNIYSTNSVNVNEWNFATVVRNSTNYIVYLNNTPTFGVGAGGSISQGRQWSIGAQNNVNNFLGLIDEFAIFNNIISPLEASILYNNNNGVQYPFNNIPFSIIAIEQGTNTPINIFNASFNNTFYSTTNGTINTNIIDSSESYNIVISADGYISRTYNNYNLSLPLVAELSRDNELLFNFRDEQTNLPILNVNYTLISSSFSINDSTTNGKINFTSLPQGTYELRYDSDGYNPRSAFFFVPLTPLSVINNTLYLLNLTVGDYYLPVILDENENVVPNSYFQALRWFVLGNGTGEYRVVETSSIDAQGKATLFLEFNTASYIFRILQNEILLQTFPTPKFLFSQVEFYRFSEGSQLISSYKNLGDIQINLQFIQSTDDFFRLEFNNPNNFASEVCLNVNFRGYNGTNVDTTTTTCSIAAASTLTTIVNLSQTGVFRGWVSITANNDGTVYVLDEIVFDNRYNTGFNTGQTAFMLLMLSIFIMIAILVAISAPLVGGGLIVLILLAFSPALLGIVNISPLWIGGLILIFIILAYIFTRGDKN